MEVGGGGGAQGQARASSTPACESWPWNGRNCRFPEGLGTRSRPRSGNGCRLVSPSAFYPEPFGCGETRRCGGGFPTRPGRGRGGAKPCPHVDNNRSNPVFEGPVGFAPSGLHVRLPCFSSLGVGIHLLGLDPLDGSGDCSGNADCSSFCRSNVCGGSDSF